MNQHTFNMSTLVCDRCGKHIFAASYPCMSNTTSVKACCGNGSNNIRWNANTAQWECKDCGAVKSNDPNYLYSGYKPESPTWVASPYEKKKCTCGSSAVGSDRHSDWCDLYKK